MRLISSHTRMIIADLLSKKHRSPQMVNGMRCKQDLRLSMKIRSGRMPYRKKFVHDGFGACCSILSESRRGDLIRLLCLFLRTFSKIKHPMAVEIEESSDQGTEFPSIRGSGCQAGYLNGRAFNDRSNFQSSLFTRHVLSRLDLPGRKCKRQTVPAVQSDSDEIIS